MTKLFPGNTRVSMGNCYPANNSCKSNKKGIFVDVKKLLLCIGLCLGAGQIGGLFTWSEIPTWYAGLKKPPFNPPGWLFGPVWTVLYIMMGIALYKIWRKPSVRMRSKNPAYGWFAVQLALNTAWSGVFFGLHSLSGGLAVLVALWLAIGGTVLTFRRFDTGAAWLLIPYWLWTTFAGYLNYMFWRLNG